MILIIKYDISQYVCLKRVCDNIYHNMDICDLFVHYELYQRVASSFVLMKMFIYYD